MNIGKRELNPPFLDEEEKEIIDSFYNGKFQSADNLTERKQELKDAAKATLKRRAINIRLQERDLRRIKTMARKDGIPYQTLIASVLHRYADGTLKRVE